MIIEIQAAAVALAMVALLVYAGYILGKMALDEELARVAAMLIERQAQDIEQLARLRMFLEMEAEGPTTEQALLLMDVCHQLGYSEGDIQRVVGPAYLLVGDAPIQMEGWDE
jgi:hypothetical protein